MRALPIAIIVLAFAGFAAADDKKDEKIDPKKLIGKWEPVEEGMKAKVVIEFFAENNKVRVQYTPVGGKTNTSDAIYKVDGNKIEFSKPDNKDDAKTVIVSTLTDVELVGLDSSGMQLRLRKILPKK